MRIKYRKITNPNLPAAQYWPEGYTDSKGKEHINKVVIKVDPILKRKKNSKLRKIILKHETDEINARKKGHKLREAHKIAESKEPKWFNKKFRTHKQLQWTLRNT